MTRYDAQLIFGAVIIIFTNVIFQELLHNPVLGPYLAQLMSLRMKLIPFINSQIKNQE
jgi:hypothetical protein